MANHSVTFNVDEGSIISKARTPCGLCRRDESPYIGWSVQMFQTPCALGTG